MLYTCSESQSDLENETNFGTVQHNRLSVTRPNTNNVKSMVMARRASECSGIAYNDSVSYRSGGSGSLRRTRSVKSNASSSSTGSTGSSGSTCSGDDTSSSSGQPNLPYPGFVEYSLKYLSQDAKPRNWCLQLITNPYPFSN